MERAYRTSTKEPIGASTAAQLRRNKEIGEHDFWCVDPNCLPLRVPMQLVGAKEDSVVGEHFRTCTARKCLADAGKPEDCSADDLHHPDCDLYERSTSGDRTNQYARDLDPHRVKLRRGTPLTVPHRAAAVARLGDFAATGAALREVRLESRQRMLFGLIDLLQSQSRDALAAMEIEVHGGVRSVADLFVDASNLDVLSVAHDLRPVHRRLDGSDRDFTAVPHVFFGNARVYRAPAPSYARIVFDGGIDPGLAFEPTAHAVPTALSLFVDEDLLRVSRGANALRAEIEELQASAGGTTVAFVFVLGYLKKLVIRGTSAYLNAVPMGTAQDLVVLPIRHRDQFADLIAFLEDARARSYISFRARVESEMRARAQHQEQRRVLDERAKEAALLQQQAEISKPPPQALHRNPPAYSPLKSEGAVLIRSANTAQTPMNRPKPTKVSRKRSLWSSIRDLFGL